MKSWYQYAWLVGLVAGMVVTSGCGASFTPPKNYTFNTTREYDKPYDEVWSRIVQWFALSGNPVKNMDKGSGFIATDYNLSVQDVSDCDCGKAGFNLVEQVVITEKMGNFNLLIQQKDGGKTMVTVTAKFYSINETRTNSGTSMGYVKAGVQKVECNSTGKLEGEILDYIGRP